MNYEILKTAKILYVEDEEDVLRFSAIALEDYVGKLYTARNGFEALDILESQQVDLIIMDILLPQLGGIELIKKTKQYFSRSLPIIITTAYAETNYLLEAINLGVDGYILKPIEVEKLLQNMERALLPKMQASEIASKNLLLEAISVFVGGKKIEIIKYLLEHCDEENIFYGSYEEIVSALNVSKPTVVKTFKQLIDTGLLKRIKNKVYHLHSDVKGAN